MLHGPTDSLRILRATCVLAGALALAGGSSSALAGPPFQTDDPEPVDLGHYEFYVFAATDGTPLGDRSDRAGLRVQLGRTARIPNCMPIVELRRHRSCERSAVCARRYRPERLWLLDTELGIKYRFIPQSDTVPEVGIFPMIELPTGSYSRGLGVGKTWYKLPLWIQKDFGPWTTYGGGGYQVVDPGRVPKFPLCGVAAAAGPWGQVDPGGRILLSRAGGIGDATNSLGHDVRFWRLLLFQQTRLSIAVLGGSHGSRPVRDIRLPWPLLDLGCQGH